MPTSPPARLLLILSIILAAGHLSRCQDDYDDYDDGGGGGGSAADVPLFAGIVYDRLMTLTGSFTKELSHQLNFCIKDSDNDWNQAFNFSSDLRFLVNCVKKKGDLTSRLCNAAEIKFYFNSFYDKTNENTAKTNILKPNNNCNLSSWVPGCEPGWACSVDPDQKVKLNDSKVMPGRTYNCNTCCPGFFCPRGLTCMIPCPLGAYCPVAKLNKTSGVCDPYNYQLPPGQPNHTCGGADMWADVYSTNQMFCPPGYYCPSTIQKISCSSGHYCRRGSTSEIKCFKKSSCKPNSSNQDITIFGGLVMVALCLILLIIYNFSGQVLSNRERRQAKSREAAARSARETVHARERWKSAKDVAKKHVVGLAQLSRTLSRKTSTGLGISRGSSEASSSKNTGFFSKKEPSNLTKMIQSLEENPESDEGFNVQIGDKNVKKNMPKGKQMHTRSQIFKYAYGQIEKEKALEQQKQNLTFSGVISMATETDIKTRPVMEIAFKDLTLTLRGSKKRLLRSVTGRLMPGRVAAVMGPSGAGKTTFLSALAGKTTGCEVTGLVLINGKAEPIRSYKRIIGFVPQDDIVHGNLTVEENLWFSARCRLSAELSKADKVLVVERIIESLGLQEIRDSLVGTVEERGISGGQRKRVNVGLEMVMEPSLLILDEPTSGLDSASSSLLLKALRREALEGVTICMVVHQPSYTLYKMFDDLILLAKGGLTVYHGSVKKVEEYFSGLGINVPERVNPPDYYIDILEGITKPNAATGITCKQLPLRWMLHNEYDVPRDMLHDDATSDASNRGGEKNSVEADAETQSIAGEVWDNVKDIVGQRKDDFENNFLHSADLSNRFTPDVMRQFKYFFGRVCKQRLRDARIQGVDFLILGLAGVTLGTLAKMSDDTFGSLGYTYTVIAVSLLCTIGALKSFSLEKLQYLRERGSGMSSLAYFLARDTIDHFNTLVKPIVYLSMFYFFNNPRSSFTDNYIILVALVYCVTGIGYFFAIFFQYGTAQLWSALMPVVLTLIATQETTSKFLANMCYTKWALEAFVIVNAERYTGVWLITRCGSLMQSGYHINDWGLCIVVLILYGMLSRCIAFFCMVTVSRH